MTRGRWFAAALVVLGLMIWVTWPQPKTGGPDAPGREPVEGSGVNRSAPNEDCESIIARLRADLDGLEPLRALELEAKLAQGQARRVAGEPQPWPDLLDPDEQGARLRQALHALDGELRVTALDCDEYPCIVGGASPRPDGYLSTNELAGLIASLPDLKVRWSWSPGIAAAPTRVYFVLGTSEDEPPIVQNRVHWRASRAGSGRHPDPPLPPVAADPLPSDPCGPEAQAARQRLADHHARATHLREVIARGWSIVDEVEGVAQDAPDDPRVHMEAAVAVASRLGLQLESLECDEAPCLVELRAAVPEGTLEADVRARLAEALVAAGYEPMLPMVKVTRDPSNVYAYGPLTPRGETFPFTRIWTRMADEMRELTLTDLPASPLDWTVPLPPLEGSTTP